MNFVKDLICKEFWVQIFGKQIDRLQTNYAGMYVLKDDIFKPTARIPFDLDFASKSPTTLLTALAEFDILARPYASYAVGLLRGALSAFGLSLTLAFRFEAPSGIGAGVSAANVATLHQSGLKGSRPSAVFTFCLQTTPGKLDVPPSA